MKTFACVRESDIVDTVLDFAAVAVVLAFDADGVFPALGRAGFVDAHRSHQDLRVRQQ